LAAGRSCYGELTALPQIARFQGSLRGRGAIGEESAGKKRGRGEERMEEGERRREEKWASSGVSEGAH